MPAAALERSRPVQGINTRHEFFAAPSAHLRRCAAQRPCGAGRVRRGVKISAFVLADIGAWSSVHYLLLVAHQE